MKHIALLLTAIALAACGKSGDDTATNTAEATPPAADKIEPGLYRQATTLLDLKDSSLQGEQAAAAAKAIGTTQTAERCVTPEMVGDPQKLVREDVDPACTVERSHWTGGRIDFAMNCPENDELTGGSFALTGTYDKSAYHFELNATGAGEDRMKMRVDAERIGECQA